MTGDIFWTAGSFFTNPTANTTLVQSASLTPGIYEVNVTIYCTAMAILEKHMQMSTELAKKNRGLSDPLAMAMLSKGGTA